MSWRTNSLVLGMRNVGRALGVNRYVGGLMQRGYEEDFEARLLEAIRPGDVVWDIGANVGLYTRRFSALAGAQGQVVAFEPSPQNFRRLQAACADLANVRLQPCGLGDAPGTLSLQQGDDALGATSRIGGPGQGVPVEIHVGDALVADGLPAPNMIKLDVEGFEGEVLRGLSRTLESPALRALGIEVHFGILAERGMADAPRAIEQRLRAAGFAVAWPDASHIFATRRT